jgi:hypothetical protein
LQSVIITHNARIVDEIQYFEMSLRGYLSADNNDDKDDRNSFRDFKNKPVPIILQDVDNTIPELSEFHSEKTLDTIRDFIRSEMYADNRYDKK